MTLQPNMTQRDLVMLSLRLCPATPKAKPPLSVSR